MKKTGAFRKDIFRDRWLYVFLILPLGYYLLFKYGPMYGVLIAFKDYKIGLGIDGSPWVGLKHFARLVQSSDFFNILKNTLLLNVYALIFGFPVPVIIAILLNEVRRPFYKRMVQSVLYLPHFMSWVVLGGIFTQMLSPSTGIVNTILRIPGITPIYFLANNFWWPIIFIISGIWQGAGWGSIVYLAAISNIDPELYESARIDGANKLAQIWHITLPCIKSTVSIMLILRMGSMMDVGFEHIYNLQNPVVYAVSDVISTYVYRVGIMGSQYSYPTAIGLFQSVVSMILVVSANKIVRCLGESSLW
ncbi:MAG: ABC transporter permease subunit [Spirochaetaceae bacterium]|jgi:putative aldouronate transport system permease protein|nr:ABC transporter permease subunit [Spirochaetaceae bacterium]